MKSAGKARNNGLYRHIRTSKEIIRNLLNDYTKSPYPIAPIWLFYILTFCLIYGFLYLLFYGCALIGNFIKMARIKCVLDSALKAKKDISVVAIEVQLNFLVSKLLGGDKQASREFYNELIEIIEKSSMNNKDELIAYLKERYTAF